LPQPSVQQLDVGQPNPSNPRFRVLRAIHEQFAPNLATALSAFLRSDLEVSLQDLSVQSSGGFRAALPSPTCFMVFRLHPRDERMYLHLNCATVFVLLEFLLGGKAGSEPAVARNLTEIEWSLLEEIVRVMVRPLGEAWKVFAPVEFEVESLVSEPGLLPDNDPNHPPGQPLIRLAFDLRYGEQRGLLEIAVPQSFFDGPEGSSEEQEPEHATESGFRHRLMLLEAVPVSLEIRMDGPLLPVADLMSLKPGQVIKLDHPLDRPVRGVVNGALTMEGTVVSSGTKRAFQVMTLP